jgi:hypothetical protein
MSSIATAAIIFACTFGGSWLGMAIGRRLPAHHLDEASRDTIKQGMGLIATMTALILGLLIASAKSAYDAQRSAVAEMSAKVMFLDRILALYGAPSAESRAALRAMVTDAHDRIWPGQAMSSSSSSSSSLPSSPPPLLRSPSKLDPMAASGEALYPALEQLAPENDWQRLLKNQALNAAADLGFKRWDLYGHAGSSVPMPFMLIVIFWLSVIFVGFGLLSPGNRTVQLTLLLCAVSVAAALFLILELDRPFDGLIRISDAPLRNAMEHLGR